MFYRRKIILSLLQIFEGKLEKVRLQKLLMLLSKMQQEPSYHFVPYKFGCFSFHANADLKTMTKYSQIVEMENEWVKSDKTNYLNSLKEKDKQALKSLKLLYGTKSTDELVKYTYIKYPYLAINSTIAKNILRADEYKTVVKARPTSNDTVLYTIGYEGVSFEEYLNKLLKYNISVLIDTRNKPMSMKYGFNKNQLQKACEGIGIKYIHIPEVGIESEQRTELNSQKDYDKLFEVYRKETLPKTKNNQLEILKLLQQNNRVALTCFEANICQCHRKHLAEAITKLQGWKYELMHI